MKAVLIAAFGLIAASPDGAQDVVSTQDAPRPVGKLTHACRMTPGGVSTIVVTGNVTTPGVYPVPASGTKRQKPDMVLQKDVLCLPANSTEKDGDVADRDDSKFQAPDPR